MRRQRLQCQRIVGLSSSSCFNLFYELSTDPGSVHERPETRLISSGLKNDDDLIVLVRDGLSVASLGRRVTTRLFNQWLRQP